MRLINTETLELEEFSVDIPRYAILSHRWSDEEILYSDFRKQRNSHFRGYQKVLAACKLARDDGYAFMWVDTCCIDKRSSAELSEAINSMFRWYGSAEVCYAYLEDVGNMYESGGEDMFARSAWFTRGWTLQELIAPSEIHFYDRTWHFIGAKSAILERLARITGISAIALRRDVPLSQFTVAERLSWAATRMTTRVEDHAYSLLGLLDVNMPLLYGEGRKAFARLQENILRTSPDLSILAWSTSRASEVEIANQPLATFIGDFSRSSSLVPTRQTSGEPWPSEVTVTNVALRVTGFVVNVTRAGSDQKRLALILNCRNADDITSLAALRLTPTFGIQGKLALHHDHLHCTIGWPEDKCSERLVEVDVLEADVERRLMTVIIDRRDNLENAVRHIQPRSREWTHVWVRFADFDLKRSWTVIDLYPQRYWRYQSLTFDLAKARTENMRQESSTSTTNDISTFGLPVHGGVALQDKSGNSVAIFFCQRNATLESGITYDIVPYEPQMFRSSEQRMLERNVGTAHSITLVSGESLEVELLVENISENVVAHLATRQKAPIASSQMLTGAGATVSVPVRDTESDRSSIANSSRTRVSEALHGRSLRRNPLQLLKRKDRGPVTTGHEP
jgi:hypothetical protein